MEFRRSVTNAAGTHAEILVRADPADEIAESWEDARSVLGLLLAFSLIVIGLVMPVSFVLNKLWTFAAVRTGRLDLADPLFEEVVLGDDRV